MIFKPFTLVKVKAAAAILDANEVPQGDRWMYITTDKLPRLIDDLVELDAKDGIRAGAVAICGL